MRFILPLHRVRKIIKGSKTFSKAHCSKELHLGSPSLHNNFGRYLHPNRLFRSHARKAPFLSYNPFHWKRVLGSCETEILFQVVPLQVALVYSEG